MNLRLPLGSSSVLPAAEPVETTGEDFPAADLPAAKEGVDILPEPPTRLDRNPRLLQSARARNCHSLVERTLFARQFIPRFCTLTF